MERDSADREALRRKAEEARAALKQDCEDDCLYVTGRPKFAPPVKSLKHDVFGEKLQSSLGAFEEVAPLLQTLKNRPVCGVSACPQTPAPTGGHKPSFPVVSDQQPSTSTAGQDAEAKRGDASSSRRAVTGGGQSRSPRARGDSAERNRKRANGEVDQRTIDKNGRRNDRHGHDRRAQPDSRVSGANRKEIRDIDRRNDQLPINSRRHGDNQGDGSGQSAVGRQKEAGARSSEDKEKVINRHDREKQEQRRYEKKDSPVVKQKTAIGESSRNSSHSRSPSGNTSGDATSVDAAKATHKRDHSASRNAKKHGQPTLRLEGVSNARLQNKDDYSRDVTSTPSIEKMIKKITDIVEAPPLSGIPPAGRSTPPFSYPIKVEESEKSASDGLKTGRRHSGSEGATRKSPQNESLCRQDASADVERKKENGCEKKTTLEADLSMSESEDDCVADRNEMHEPRDEFSQRKAEDGCLGDAQSEKSSLDAVASTSPVKSDAPVQPKYTWSISSLLESMTPLHAKHTPSQSSCPNSSLAIPSTSAGIVPNRKADKHKKDRNGKARSTGDRISERPDREPVKNEPDVEAQRGPLNSPEQSVGRELKMSLKVKNGKVRVVDKEKGEDGSETQSAGGQPRPAARMKTKRTTAAAKRNPSPPKGADDQGSKRAKTDQPGTSDTGKENMKGLSSAEEAGQDAKKCKSIDDGDNFQLYGVDAEAILRESRLSPLLSPIHEFPPLEFVNGKPTLLCQIPLNLLDRIPPPKSKRQLLNGWSATGDENCAKPDDASTNSHDLDDVPILDRIVNNDQKKRLSVGGSKSTSGATTQKTDAGPKASAKRKPVADCEPAEGPPAKAPRLEPNVTIEVSDAPSKAVELDLDCAKEQQYQTQAKDVKHHADSQTDKTLRILLYLESVVYFIMTGLCMEKKLSKRNKDSSTPHTMIKTTMELLKSVAQKFIGQMSSCSNTSQTGYVTKIDILSLRIQSMCCYKMFQMRQTQAFSNYRQLNEFHKTADRASSSAPSSVTHPSSKPAAGGQQSAGGEGVTPSPTPSPASSTGSSHSLPPGLVAIPQQIESLYKQQLSHLHSLMWAHYHWQQGEQRLQSLDDKAFFDHLAELCGPLTLTSDLPALCTYVLTAVTWLRQAYERQRR